MYNEDWAPLYRETFARLHCPAAVRLPPPARPARRRLAPAVLCAAALAACGAAAAGGITLRALQQEELAGFGKNGFCAVVDLPLTPQAELPAAVQQQAGTLRPVDELADYIDRADSGAQDPNGAWITAQTGAPRGADYTAGEALLPFESWQQAAGFLGWALEPPAAAETMHPVQGALAADDRESYFRALVRLNGDAATGALERVGLSQTWSDATGLLSVSVSELVGDGETGTLTAELRFAQGDTAWQAQDYTMPDGTAATLAVPQEGADANGLFAFFAKDGRACTVAWLPAAGTPPDEALSHLQEILDSFV